jgi:hypothetical protein
MKPTQNEYPVFEANQVLTSEHLNQAISYLDEQERLTRANLIGIGIVCGLEIKLDVAPVTTIHISKGCGVTSEGYLIVEPDDMALVSYRNEYKIPDELNYPSFKDSASKQYPLWELFPAGEPDTTSLDAFPDFLEDKAVLLFLELKKASLRNCSPNNCDDKGAEVTATVRRLLIKVDDLSKIIAAANQLETDLTAADLEALLLARLNLPDLRLPRYDVPNTNPVTSNQVLSAFQAVFRADKLTLNTGDALIASYNAFKPVLQATYPTNPFADFKTNFGFLDNTLNAPAQARFLPYYVDFFDDLLRAYDEFRWKGVALLCVCCPSERLFPRHLMLGVLFPATVPNQSIYRHHFLPSSTLSGCAERTRELEQLFQRMVELTARFTNTPLPELTTKSLPDLQIRITPSKLADVPLSDKAIPYYYLQNGNPPLFQLWNAEKTRRNRANQNLSYRSDKYTPPAPLFVTDALRYDLEPYNFLRIEGHLGKNYQQVLESLLTLKSKYRLPIEVIALRTGLFDETISVDLSKEECRFQDLEALYDTIREELLCTLCEGIMYLYGIPIGEIGLAAGTPQIPLLKKYAPNYRYPSDTVGAWYEKYYNLIQSKPYIDVDQNKVGDEVLKVYCILFTGTTDLSEANYAHVVSVYYLAKLAEILPSSLNQLSFVDFENKYQDLMGLIRYFRSNAESQISDEFRLFIPQEDLIDHFDQVLFSCKLEPVREIHEEYMRRIREVKKKQFLSNFLKKNPGIQHKAGVPLGGTFIIVYHDNPDLKEPAPGFAAGISLLNHSSSSIASSVPVQEIADALARLQAKKDCMSDDDLKTIVAGLNAKIPTLDTPPGSGEINQNIDKIIADTVTEFADGTVIADFFLPYLCCSDCSPVQFVLPEAPLTFTVKISCTGPDKQLQVTVMPQGGVAPYFYKLNDDDFKQLSDQNNLPILPAGSYQLVIRDSEGTESTLQTLIVPDELAITELKYIDDKDNNTYQVSFNISGGIPPYTVENIVELAEGDSYTSNSVKSGETLGITITDANGCQLRQIFRHVICDLPCDGKSMRCEYPLWLQPPDKNRNYERYELSTVRLEFVTESSNNDFTLDINKLQKILTHQNLNKNFKDTINRAIEALNNSLAGFGIEGSELPANKRLEITLDDPENPQAILMEYFVCDIFGIEFKHKYQIIDPSVEVADLPSIAGRPEAGDDQIIEETVRYTNNNKKLSNNNDTEEFNGRIILRKEKEIRDDAKNCKPFNRCDN